jgi:hypothetical protein
VSVGAQERAPAHSLPEGTHVLRCGRSMNPKHAESSLKISDESHTGKGPFIPFCLTQGCQWIGNPHADEHSARDEGHVHLAQFITLAVVRALPSRRPSATGASPPRMS